MVVFLDVDPVIRKRANINKNLFSYLYGLQKYIYK